MADDWKRTKIETLSLMLNGAMAAQNQVGLMLNVSRANLDAVLNVLPALNSPTISELRDKQWVAVNTILEQGSVRDIIPKLKAAGGTGIVEFPLSKVVL